MSPATQSGLSFGSTMLPRRRLSRTEQNEQKRELLLAAGWEVIAERGYHATSLEEVAERAGFTRQPIYTLFGSKEQLALALHERVITHNLALLDRIKLGRTLKGTLARLVDLVRELQEKPEFKVHQELTNTLATIALNDVNIRRGLAAILEPNVARFASWFRRCAEATGGSFRIPVERFTWIVVAATYGLTELGAIEASFGRPELLRDLIMAFVSDADA